MGVGGHTYIHFTDEFILRCNISVLIMQNKIFGFPLKFLTIIVKFSFEHFIDKLRHKR